MPSKWTIADEVRDERTATVFSDKSLKTGTRYAYLGIASGTATGSVMVGAGLLHAVVLNASAAGASFWLWDNADSASAAAIGSSASAVARYSGLPIGVHVYNAIINSGLQYRLSATAADGISLIYRRD